MRVARGIFDNSVTVWRVASGEWEHGMGRETEGTDGHAGRQWDARGKTESARTKPNSIDVKCYSIRT
jgi:hypothetical protein